MRNLTQYGKSFANLGIRASPPEPTPAGSSIMVFSSLQVSMTWLGCATDDENSRIISWCRLWEREFSKYKLHSKDSTPTKKKNHYLRLLRAWRIQPPIVVDRPVHPMEAAWQCLPCIFLDKYQYCTSNLVQGRCEKGCMQKKKKKKPHSFLKGRIKLLERRRMGILKKGVTSVGIKYCHITSLQFANISKGPLHALAVVTWVNWIQAPLPWKEAEI